MSEPIRLIKTEHPDKTLVKRYEGLIGLEWHKKRLLGALETILTKDGFDKWAKKHHSPELPFYSTSFVVQPLIILHGEVGCGKTELASTVGSPLAKSLNKTVISFETPSDIRGGGHVGELSERITASFTQAKREITGSKNAGLLIIDEGDDLATSRSQNQAHHEDRAGVNVLIKEIDRIGKEKTPLAVILITNRKKSLDPAILRRASSTLEFQRPNAEVLNSLFEHILAGTKYDSAVLSDLVGICLKKAVLFTYSDILNRVAVEALIDAKQSDKPFSAELLKESLNESEPTPLID